MIEAEVRIVLQIDAYSLYNASFYCAAVFCLFQHNLKYGCWRNFERFRLSIDRIHFDAEKSDDNKFKPMSKQILYLQLAQPCDF